MSGYQARCTQLYIEMYIEMYTVQYIVRYILLYAVTVPYTLLYIVPSSVFTQNAVWRSSGLERAEEFAAARIGRSLGASQRSMANRYRDYVCSILFAMQTLHSTPRRRFVASTVHWQRFAGSNSLSTELSPLAKNFCLGILGVLRMTSSSSGEALSLSLSWRVSPHTL